MEDNNVIFKDVLTSLQLEKRALEKELERLHNNPNDYHTQIKDIVKCVKKISLLNIAILTYVDYIPREIKSNSTNETE